MKWFILIAVAVIAYYLHSSNDSSSSSSSDSSYGPFSGPNQVPPPTGGAGGNW